MNRRAFLSGRLSRTPAEVPLMPLNIRAGLESYGASLAEAEVAHLFRRTCFGVTPQQRATWTGQRAAAAVDQLIQDALNNPYPDTPVWVNESPPPRGSSDADVQHYNMNNAQWRREYYWATMDLMRTGGLREKMVLFWSNHFVTEIQKYRLAPLMYRYATLLRKHALGNFRTFVYEMGLEAAMLIYLDGNRNQVGAPNENYARELLELFTMGPKDQLGNKNYTDIPDEGVLVPEGESDIRQIARALTGWIFDDQQLGTRFIPRRHDDGMKTFFGRTGNFGYDAVIDILFEERPGAIAHFVCRKLYQEFVYAAPDEAIVGEMATMLLANGWEVRPVVETLLKSAHFFDSQVNGAGIKSPVAMVTGMMMEMAPDADLGTDSLALLHRSAALMGQELFNPPNVAGWPGHHVWLDTTTMPLRWLLSDVMVFGNRGQHGLDLVPLAAALYDPDDPLAAFELPVKLAEHLFPVPVDSLDIANVSEDFAGDLANNPIPDAIANGPAYRINLAKIFLGDTPWYEWYLYLDGANGLLQHYTSYLAQQPEFQLT